MSFTSKDYRRVGHLFYPVIFGREVICPARGGKIIERLTIEVVDEPINELELREMINDEVIHRFDGY